jgi:hypothetical protein
MNAYPKTESLLPRRVVTLDIETISTNPQDPNGALDARTGRIVCIGLLIDNAVGLNPLVICDQDEKKILERFWTTITENDVLVGHNILAFDLMFIRQRSWILGVKPPIALNLRKYYTETVIDLMEMWTNWSTRYKGAGLDNIAQALGVGQKNGHGSEVGQMWAAGEYVKVMDYCMSDVWLAYNVYCRLHYREPLGVPLPVMVPKPERELVCVAQQKGPDPAVNGNQAHLQANLPEATVPQPSNGNGNGRKRSQKVTYLELGGALVLNGNTYVIKDSLKALGGRRSKKGDDWIWQVPAARFNDLAGLCAQNSIQLKPADGTLSIPKV